MANYVRLCYVYVKPQSWWQLGDNSSIDRFRWTLLKMIRTNSLLSLNRIAEYRTIAIVTGNFHFIRHAEWLGSPSNDQTRRCLPVKEIKLSSISCIRRRFLAYYFPECLTNASYIKNVAIVNFILDSGWFPVVNISYWSNCVIYGP